VLGATVYREREYAALRIRTRRGLAGTALGHMRGVPVPAMLERLAHGLVGRDPLCRAALIYELQTRNANGRASLVRALSLVDIALFDLLAQAAELPLWRLLGGMRSRVPLLAVAGYGASPLEEQVRALADAGFRYIKAHCTDPQLVARCARPDISLGVDLHMSCRTLPDALALCRRLDELDLAFLEDPFTPERHRLYAQLAPLVRTPLAAGEDAVGLEALRDLADAVAILRVDGTASGGFGVALDACVLAAAAGCELHTHAFPELHAHLAGGRAELGLVELIPHDSGGNPAGELALRRGCVEGGELVLGEEPGHGFPLDWDAVARRATALTTIDKED
jgi:L-alanine-DL-glutamate epimerase-like enolase superfamily enzyme